jgi:hypothetical protein
MVEVENFKKIMAVPFSIIFASFVIIIITFNVEDKNALYALISGYFGLFLGLFLITLSILYEKQIPNSQNDTSFLSIFKYMIQIILDIFPILMTLCIISVLIYYLYTYFDKIVNGQVSSYYNGFLLLSIIFSGFQMLIFYNSFYDRSKNSNSEIFSNVNFSLSVLVDLINLFSVITIGIILRYYSTQG